MPHGRGLRAPLRKGRLRARLRDETLEVEAGTMVVVPPGARIEAVDVSADFRVSIVAATYDRLDEVRMQKFSAAVGREKKALVVRMDQADWEMIRKEFSLLWILTQRRAMREEMVNLKLGYVLDACSVMVGCSKGETLYERLLDLVEEYGSRHRTLAFYADRLCVTKRHLCDVVRRDGKTTVLALTKRATVAAATNLLLHSSMPIGEIGRALGFRNETYFSIFFKRLTNMTPTEWRQRNT